MSGRPLVDRARPPAPEAVREFAFPRFERRVLEPGLRLLVAPVHRTDLVDIRLLTQAGAQFDPAARAGLAHLVSSVQDEGTRGRTADQIAQAIEQLGGYLSTGVNWDAASVSCGVLARHVETALELLADVASRPSFPQPEVERLKGQILAEIERRDAQPSSLASRHLARVLYGGGVYGHPLIGDAGSVDALDRDHLIDFWDRRFSAAGATLIVTGAVNPDDLVDLFQPLCRDWPTLTQAAVPTFEPLDLGNVEVTLVDRPEAAQTELRLGHVGLPRRHPDYLTAAVMNCLLGGRFMSRINLNLRERHGYTYGASSSFSKRLGPGPFVVSTAAATEHAPAAATEILKEMERLQQELVEEVELTETKNYLIGTFPYTTQTLEGITARLYELAVFDLPDDYYATFGDAIRNVAAEDIRSCAARHLRPDRLAVVAVGPQKQLRAGFERLGRVHVVADRRP